MRRALSLQHDDDEDNVIDDVVHRLDYLQSNSNSGRTVDSGRWTSCHVYLVGEGVVLVERGGGRRCYVQHDAFDTRANG